MKSDAIRISKRWRPAAYLAVALCLAMIFLFSSQSKAESSSLSAEVTRVLIETFSGSGTVVAPTLFDRLHHVVRKLAHASEYALLALSCVFLAHTYPLSPAVRYGGSALVCLAAASLDEILQATRFGRNGMVTDVLIDLVGAVAMLLIVFAFSRLKEARRNRTPVRA